ncbi:MAG: hypothetical protein R2911_32250 [Caldilineaceae bacterium]
MNNLASLPNSLAHIYWIGGAPCAGKSTTADWLAKEYGLDYYQVDAYTQRHQEHASAASHSTFWRLNQLNGDALWMRPLEEQVLGAIAYCAEQFELVLADLRALPTIRPILAEGTSLLPHLVAPLLSHKHQAIWLAPEPPFQRKYYSQRPWIHDVLISCSNPAQAFANWMERDIRFANWVEAQAQAAGLTCLRVHENNTILQNAQRIAHHFGLHEPKLGGV